MEWTLEEHTDHIQGNARTMVASYRQLSDHAAGKVMAVGESIVTPLLDDSSRIASNERLNPVRCGGIADPVGEACRAQDPATTPAFQGNATAHAQTRASLDANLGEWEDVGDVFTEELYP